MARPSKYNKKYHLPWIRGLARQGMTVEQIAKELEVAKKTLYNWMEADEELLHALNEGRNAADSKVEDSLYSRAIGYVLKETKKIIKLTADGQQEPSRIEITEKELAPDVTACIFWLKNRKPKDWRDKREMEITESDDALIKEWIANLGLEEQDAEVLEEAEEGRDVVG